jgi:hypothetical protein
VIKYHGLVFLPGSGKIPWSGILTGKCAVGTELVV